MGCSAAVQGAFYKRFYNWGHFVGRCPFLVIVLSTVISIAMSFRLILHFTGRSPMPSISEQEQLWVPQEAQAITDKGKYDAIFTNTFRRNTLYFTTNPPGGNVLTSPVLAEIRRFDRMVTETLNATAHGSGRSYTALHDDKGYLGVAYNDVCARSTIAFGQNLSDPNDEGGIPCVLFGHPLEVFYQIGGVTPGRVDTWLPGDFNFSFSDAQINAILTAGRGPDETLFPPDSNRTVNVEGSYGGITRDANNHITGAKSVALTYLLGQHPIGSHARKMAEAWEDQLNMLIGPSPNGKMWTYDGLSDGSASVGDVTWSSPLISIFPQTEGATSRELSKNISGDILGLNIGFFIILAYAVFIFSRCHPVKSRVLLALSGCASVGLSIAVAYGFTTLLGFATNPVINVLPFVLIGIGVDDMFVLVTALEAQPSDLPVKERMARAMGTAGVSITITSLTDLFAFALGTGSALPALSTFCVFAAIGIAADFLLQISFFAGFMAWDCYREKKQKPDCCPCCCPKPVDADNGCCCFRFCYGKFPCVESVKGREGTGCIQMVLVLMVNGLKAWMVQYYIPLMRKQSCKIFVIAAFTVFTAISAFYASQLKQDFQFRWFVNDDAPLQQAFTVQDDYFSGTGLPVYVVTPSSASFDYASIAGQQKLAAMATAVGASKWIESDSVSEWYGAFREWVHTCGTMESFTSGPLAGTSCKTRDCAINMSGFGGGTRKLQPYCSTQKELRDAGANNLVDAYGFDIPGAPEAKYMVKADGVSVQLDGAPIEDSFIPPAMFWPWLDQFLADAPLGAIVASEIVWVSNATAKSTADVALGIKATRVRATYLATDKADDQVESMFSLRKDVAAVGLGDAFPYMFMYLYYEQYAIITREALTNLGLALLAVFVIVMLTLANVGCTLLVMMCVILVDCDILGLMQMWGLTIDSVSIINLVLAIGLSVDYSVHVAHAFLQTPGTKQERVDHALEEMGTAVIHGAFSTFLAVCVLSISKSYIFRIFFKQFFGICVFGAAHGLVLLPTLLSLIGPAYVDHGAKDVREEPDFKKGGGMQMTSASNVPALAPTPPTGESVSNPPSPPGSAGCSPRLPQSMLLSGSARVAPVGSKVPPHVV